MTGRVLIFSDNVRMYEGVRAFVEQQSWADQVDYACTPRGPLDGTLRAIRIKNHVEELVERYKVVVSGHCKQIFPLSLVGAVPCVNIHPGFNPDTRGWFPQVFGLVRGLRVGFTVHYMDAEIDHGPIILRREIEAKFTDDSKMLYDRIQDAEIASIPEWLPDVVFGRAQATPMEGEGFYHSKQDFEQLCAIDLEEQGTFRQFYDRLRALSFAGFKNAYVIDPKTGERVYFSLQMHKDN